MPAIPPPLSDKQYAAIRAREQAADPGPWWADSHEIHAGPHGIPALGEWVAETCVAGELERSEANARFIAHAREDVPALLRELDRLRAERDQARADAFDEAIDRFKSLANLAPDSKRAPGLNFAIGALMAMRDHPKES